MKRRCSTNVLQGLGLISDQHQLGSASAALLPSGGEKVEVPLGSNHVCLQLWQHLVFAVSNDLA